MVLENWMAWVIFFTLVVPALVLTLNKERRREAARLLVAAAGLLVVSKIVLLYWEDATQQIYLGQEWLGWLGYAVMVFFVVLGVWILTRRKKMAPYEQKFYTWVAALFWVHALLLGDVLNRVSHPGLPELLLKGPLFFCYFMLLNRLVLMLIQSEKGWKDTIKGWLARLKKKEKPAASAATQANAPAAPVRRAPRKAVVPPPAGAPVKKTPRRIRPDRRT